MPSQDNNLTHWVSTTRQDHLIAWLAALAIAIHVIESALPSPIPGVKLGLANVITVAVLIRYGWQTAAWVALLRVLIGSLIIGSFLSPTFLLSFSGALSSIIVLGLASLIPGRLFGPVGYSLLASMTHVGTQFYVAYLFFIPHQGLFHLLPVIMTAAVIFGITSGIIVHAMTNKLDRHSSP